MSATRIIFSLSDNMLELRKKLPKLTPLQPQKTALFATEMQQELKGLCPAKAAFNADDAEQISPEEQLATQEYKVALLETIRDEMIKKISIAEKNTPDSKDQPIETSYFSRENIPRWIVLVCVLFFLTILNGIGLATGGLSLFLSAFGVATLAPLFKIMIGSSFLLPPIIGTFPFIARIMGLSSPDDSESLIQPYAQQRELTKSINTCLTVFHLLKRDKFFLQEHYEEITGIVNILNEDMQELQNRLVAPQPTRLGYAALALLGTLAAGFAVEISFSFSAFLINHGLGVAAATIPSLLALNHVTFPLVFGALLIGASAFVYALYWLEINNQLNPAKKHYDALKKNLDNDAKNKKWDKSTRFLKFFDLRIDLEALEKSKAIPKESKSALPRSFSAPLLARMR